LTEESSRRTKPHPGSRTIIQFRRPVFWLAVVLDCPLPSRVSTVAVEQSRQAYSSGGCAGVAEVETSRVTGLPVSPTDRKIGGHLLKRRRVFMIAARTSSPGERPQRQGIRITTKTNENHLQQQEAWRYAAPRGFAA
jgi:hypothetical protein